MNAGAQHATGDVLLFLHSDSVLAPDALAQLQKTMDNPRIAGGSFTLIFDVDNFWLRFYAFCSTIDWLCFRYGDQGIFVRRSIFEAMGGYAEIPLMEDIDLMRRLPRYGQRCFDSTLSGHHFGPAFSGAWRNATGSLECDLGGPVVFRREAAHAGQMVCCAQSAPGKSMSTLSYNKQSALRRFSAGASSSRFAADRRALDGQIDRAVVLRRRAAPTQVDGPRSTRGVQTIPLASIVGTVGRCTDFTRSFLPRKGSDEQRWANLKAFIAQNSLDALPPIDVYQIGSAYFVQDGHHRVSIARQMGVEFISAHVTEVHTRVPLTPDADWDALIVNAEHAEFLDYTHLDRLRPRSDFAVSVPGQYEKLEDHIEVHRYFNEVAEDRDIAYEEAVCRWHDEAYLPIVEAIREQGILAQFPRAHSHRLLSVDCRASPDLAERTRLADFAGSGHGLIGRALQHPIAPTARSGGARHAQRDRFRPA